MTARRLAAVLLALWLPAGGLAEVRPFDLLRLESAASGPVLLVLAGIQGDEPGGFHAAALLDTGYRLERGRVWVVPNLNFHSILARRRGLHGDLNRKFGPLSRDDPEFELVGRIKALIEHPEVRWVLHLHDGSGFFRPQREDAEHGPHRWGQSLVIDRADLDPGDGALGELARRLAVAANRRLPERLALAVKDTRTHQGNAEMQRALTWYALGRGRVAMASEASKSLSLEARVQTHLAVIEAAMSQFGVAFRREFASSSAGIAGAMARDLELALFDRRLCLPLAEVRPHLQRVPVPESLADLADSANPLVAVVRRGPRWEVRYGNRLLTRLQVEPRPTAEPVTLTLHNAGRRLRVAPCSTARVAGEVRIEPVPGYRINAIGAPGGDDSGRWLRREDFDPRYSLDRGGRLYRLEIYRGEGFAGMVALRFADPDELAAGPGAD